MLKFCQIYVTRVAKLTIIIYIMETKLITTQLEFHSKCSGIATLQELRGYPEIKRYYRGAESSLVWYQRVCPNWYRGGNEGKEAVIIPILSSGKAEIVKDNPINITEAEAIFSINGKRYAAIRDYHNGSPLIVNREALVIPSPECSLEYFFFISPYHEVEIPKGFGWAFRDAHGVLEKFIDLSPRGELSYTDEDEYDIFETQEAYNAYKDRKANKISELRRASFCAGEKPKFTRALMYQKINSGENVVITYPGNVLGNVYALKITYRNGIVEYGKPILTTLNAG